MFHGCKACQHGLTWKETGRYNSNGISGNNESCDNLKAQIFVIEILPELGMFN